MTWSPFRKRANPQAAGAVAAALPEEIAVATDATDPLGHAPGFTEMVISVSQSDSATLDLVEVSRQGGASDRYLRLQVRAAGLAEALRSLLLESPEELCAFRDLLAGDAPLTAALEPPDFALDAAFAGPPPPPRIAELRDAVLNFLSLCLALAGRGLFLDDCRPSDIGFARSGLSLNLRFLGWTAVRGGQPQPGWIPALAKAAFAPAARTVLDTARARPGGLGADAAQSLLAALNAPDLEAMQAALEALQPRLLTHGATDTGRRRQHNEDAWLALRIEQASGTGLDLAVAAVADGMGGHAAGEVASSLALDLLRGGLATSLLMPRTRPHEAAGVVPAVHNAIVSAAAAISEMAQLDPAAAGMGTTIAGIALMTGRSTIGARQSPPSGCVFWTGDSRVYLFDYAGLRLLSHDHSLVQSLVDSGQIDAAEAWSHPQKNVVTRCLGGGGNDARPDVLRFCLGPGEIALVCSDGLSDALRDAEIEDCAAAALATGDSARRSEQLEGLAAALIRAANEAGGPDNISVVLLAG